MAEQNLISGHALYPGTFDPPTNGHISIIKRASRLFGKITIGVTKITSKNPTLSNEQRLSLLRDIFKGFPNVEIMEFTGLLVDFARKIDAKVIIRGLRDISDFDFERRMAVTNKHCFPELETVFLISDPETSFISSTLVKQIAAEGGDISDFVPEQVAKILREAR